MRKFNVSVNGKSYSVEVEEVGGAITPVAAPAPAVKEAAPAPAANKAADGHPCFLGFLGKHGQFILCEANLHSTISFSQKHSSFPLGFQGHCPRQAESVRTDSLLVKTMPPTPQFKLLRHF